MIIIDKSEVNVDNIQVYLLQQALLNTKKSRDSWVVTSVILFLACIFLTIFK